MSSQLGLPATARVDNTIIKALTEHVPWLPVILEQHLKIGYMSYRSCHTLGHYELETSGLLPNPISTILMFDSEFNALQNSLEQHWTLPTKISFLKARLALYSFACVDDTPKQGAEVGFVSKASEIRVQAYKVAMSLIHAICDSPEEVPFWTSWIRVSLVYAVIVLITLATSSQCSFADPIAVRNLINQAWDLLHGNSDMEHDHYSRICAAIEYLSRKPPIEEPPHTLNPARSRMAANMSIDFIWCAKDRFSKSVLDSKPADYTTAAEDERTFQFGLDLDLLPMDLEGYGSAWDILYPDNEMSLGDTR